MAIADAPVVLLGDDQPDVLIALQLLLKMNGYRTHTADSPERIQQALDDARFDLILMDLNYHRDTTSGREGLHLLSKIRQRTDCPVVVMTAWGSIDLAVEAMRLGAHDFVQKPWDNQHLLRVLAKAAQSSATLRCSEAKQRAELEIARHVQQQLLPPAYRVTSCLEFAAHCAPARAVGGDYFDFFELGDSQYAGLLADVCGKGVGAAILMANLQALFRSQIAAGVREPQAVVEQVHRLFYLSSPPEQYASIVYFHVDGLRRTLSVVNCGHPPPVLFRRGALMEIEATATVLGLLPQLGCAVRELAFTPGDFLVLYSDGVSETTSDDGAEFGSSELMNAMRRSEATSARVLLRSICSELEWFSGRHEQQDDRTILVLQSR